MWPLHAFLPKVDDLATPKVDDSATSKVDGPASPKVDDSAPAPATFGVFAGLETPAGRTNSDFWGSWLTFGVGVLMARFNSASGGLAD